jgi:hypothetical protein
MNRHARVSVERGLFSAFWQRNLKSMHNRREEEEEFHSGENIAEAHPPSDTEWQEERWNLNFSFGVDESTRPEFLWLVPELWVHVNAVDEWHDMRTGWDFVTVKLLVTVNETRCEINKTNSNESFVNIQGSFSFKRSKRANSKGDLKPTTLAFIHITGLRMR